MRTITFMSHKQIQNDLPLVLSYAHNHSASFAITTEIMIHHCPLQHLPADGNNCPVAQDSERLNLYWREVIEMCSWSYRLSIRSNRHVGTTITALSQIPTVLIKIAYCLLFSGRIHCCPANNTIDCIVLLSILCVSPL